MEFKIVFPTKAEILVSGVVVITSTNGEVWRRGQLGEFATKSGVYVHHSNQEILYVGKATDGVHGIFGERLRREFQTLASSNSTLHQLLCRQEQEIKTTMFDYEMIDQMITSPTEKLSQMRKALILEQMLIGLHRPIGNIR